VLVIEHAYYNTLLNLGANFTNHLAKSAVYKQNYAQLYQ